MIKLTTKFELPEGVGELLNDVQMRHGLGGSYPIEEDEWWPMYTLTDGDESHIFGNSYMSSYSQELGEYYLTADELKPKIQAIIEAMQKLKKTKKIDDSPVT